MFRELITTKTALSLGLAGLVLTAIYLVTGDAKHESVFEDVPFEHSLMVHGQKIKSYRSPASVKAAEEAEKKKITAAAQQKSLSSSPRSVDDSAGDAAIGFSEHEPALAQRSDSQATAPSSQKPKTFEETGNMGIRASGVNPFAPKVATDKLATTTPTSTGNSKSVAPDPKARLSGTIRPLVGFIASHVSNPLISQAYANVCSDARILLMDLTNMSILLDNPIEEEDLGSSTEFSFDPIGLGLNTSTPNRYMLQTTGCTTNYQRIISSFYEDQDLDQATTLISKTINTRIAPSVGSITPTMLSNLYKMVNSSLEPTDNFEDIYDKLDLSPTLKQAFQSTFNGGSSTELKEAAPDITAFTFHKNLVEKTTYVYTAIASQWDPVYVLGYEWHIDGSLVSTTSSWAYTPSANSPASITLTYYVGHKNAGDALVDRSKPYHEITFTVAIADAFPAASPAFSLATTSNNPSTTRSIDLEIATGALAFGVYDNCETFSSFAMTEDSAVPTAGDFVHTCTAGPVQGMSYNIQKTTDGSVVLKLWAKDTANRISTVAQTATLFLDTTAPVINFTGVQANYTADNTATFSWTLTEVHASNSQFFDLEFFDGSSWSTLPQVAVTNGPHVATAFSTNVTMPNLLLTGAKLRITYSDTLGQQTISETTPFNLLRPILGSSPAVINFGSVLNKAESTLSVLAITNTGVVGSKVCDAAVLAGSDPGDFLIVSDACDGASISASGNCPIGLKARPTAKGARSATISITCGLDSYSTTLSVTSTNNPPTVATTTTVTTLEETAVSINFGAVSDLDGDSTSYTFVTSPAHGTLTNCLVVSGNYTCSYEPVLNYTGADTFTFKSNDGTVDSNTGTVNITVLPANDAPTLAATQTVSTGEDTAVSFTLNAGSDLDGDALSYIVVAGPGQGSLTCTGGTSTNCTYTPPTDFEGTTTFTYKVNDGTLDSNTATVTINVSASNDPPVVGANQSVTTPEDTAVNFTLNAATDIDVPAQTLSYKLVSAPTKGTLSNCINASTYDTDRTCTYTPALNETGTDTFTYRAYDSLTDSSAVATVTITITPQNDAPVLAVSQSVSTNEDTALSFDLAAGTDTEGDTLSYIRITSTSSGSISCTGGTSRSCTYTPSANFNGTDSFTYKANDSVADSNVATVTITVAPVNDAPVMAVDQSTSTNDATNLVINLSAASDIDGGALGYKIITPPSHGTLTNCIGTGAYGTDLSCDYISAANYHGTDLFTFIANDTFTDAISVTMVTITITDNTAAPAPAITLASNVYTNSTAVSFSATNCTDTPEIFINEAAAPLDGDSGWQNCDLTPGSLTYTMGTGQGAHTVKVWAKDIYGNVSATSTNFTIYYDTVAPTMALTAPGAVRGGASYSLAWTATETYASAALNFIVEVFNGTSWSAAGTTASVAGPLAATAFTRSWSVPVVNVANAAFRVSFTDLAGNTHTQTSGSFVIDSTAPALDIDTPGAGTFHLASATMTGDCEIGRNVDFSGDIQTSFSIACPTGTYSQLVNFSNGDGNKTIYVAQTDAVGNTTTLSRNLIRDEVSPILARTTGVSPFFTQNNTPNAWGGTCEGNYTIFVSGDETTSFSCSSGSWSWTPSAKLVDGTFVYNLVQTDGAGNTSSPPLSLSWKRDATPPVFTIASPLVASADATVSLTNNLNSVTFSGSCEGTNVILISGTSSAAITCSSATWEWTTATYSTDTTRSFTFTQSDAAGNDAVLTVNWVRDTSGPMLTLTKNLKKSNANSISFDGYCEIGVNVVVSGAESQTIPCPAGTWSFASTTYASDANYAFTFTQTYTSSPFNSTSINANWIRETDPPTLSSFSTSAPNPNRSSYIPVDLTATSQNPAVAISHVCFRVDTTTTPTINHSCFLGVNSPEVGQALSQTLMLNDFSILLGWTPQDYYVYAWVKDEAGNISALGSSGNGTLGTDFFVKEYTPGIAPTVWDVVAANVSNPPLPPSRSQSEVPAGTDVYIRWKATDNTALPSGAVSIFYTSDEITFNSVVAGLDNADYGCGESLGSNEGCYRWVGGSPLNTAYKIRVKVTDATSVSNQSTTNPLNLGRIKILAGNTESGLGGSAQTAMFFTRRFETVYPDPGSLVVSKEGRFYFADYKRGIITIDQNDGKQKIFIPATGVSSGDGGPAVNATLQFATKITLDYQNRLLIHDRNRIRRVDLKAEVPTIETIIGGGSDTSATVANPLSLQISSMGDGDWASATIPFFALPNGDIYFHSDYGYKEWNQPDFRLRVYSAATGQITSRYFTGTGDAWKPTQDLSKCRISSAGIRFNPANSTLTGATAHIWYHPGWTGCEHTTTNIVRAHFNPTTFVAIPSTDDAYRWWHQPHYTGMTGDLFVMLDRNYVMRMNFDGTYTRVLGSGTQGECADGTPATSCNLDIQNLFVTTTGKFYFTDRGVIRTIEENGNVKTLFGQKLSYGDGVNALNARMSNVTKTYLLSNGKIIANDAVGYMKEFTVEGNINIIAGDGSAREVNTTVAANGSPLINGANIAVDRSTGEVYTWYKWNGYGSYVKLNRSTGMWEHVVGALSGGTHYTVGDGQPGLSIEGQNGGSIYGIPLSFENGKLVTSAMQLVIGAWENGMLKTYDAADSYRQAHLLGNIGPGADGREVCDATTPVPAANCKVPHWDTIRDAQWDATGGRWIIAGVYGGPENQIFEVFPGGNIRQIYQTQNAIHDSFLFRREGGAEVLYYCTGTRLRKVNLTTQTESAMDWSMPTLSCRGTAMSYNATNNSIIFPFEQNGLNGVGEYFLP
jgi:large repetitive protein